MNTPGIFVMGVVVTLIVGAALALLVYGAILDGRDQKQVRSRVRTRRRVVGRPSTDPDR